MYTQLQLPSEGPSQTTRFSKFESKIAASVLDISVTLFYAIDSERPTFVLTKRGAEAILFHMKSWNRQQQHDRKTFSQNQTNPVEWHPKFIRSIIHAPSFLSNTARLSSMASQARAVRVLLNGHVLKPVGADRTKASTQALFN